VFDEDKRRREVLQTVCFTKLLPLMLNSYIEASGRKTSHDGVWYERAAVMELELHL
jgi:hypothetical protein